jgi:hypothetical protein
MNSSTALVKAPMKVTVVLMGFNLKATLATGAMVFGDRSNKPQRRFEYFMYGTEHRDGANDAFEFSNAPWRTEEWVTRFGPTRSMSVGDVAIVQFRGEKIGFVCQGCGWAHIAEAFIEPTIAMLDAHSNYHDRSQYADSL